MDDSKLVFYVNMSTSIEQGFLDAINTLAGDTSSISVRNILLDSVGLASLIGLSTILPEVALPLMAFGTGILAVIFTVVMNVTASYEASTCLGSNQNIYEKTRTISKDVTEILISVLLASATAADIARSSEELTGIISTAAQAGKGYIKEYNLIDLLAQNTKEKLADKVSGSLEEGAISQFEKVLSSETTSQSKDIAMAVRVISKDTGSRLAATDLELIKVKFDEGLSLQEVTEYLKIYKSATLDLSTCMNKTALEYTENLLKDKPTNEIQTFTSIAKKAKSSKGKELNNYDVKIIDNAMDDGLGEEEIVQKVDRESKTTINGLKIIDGKVDGKIPLSIYERYRKYSIHNPNSDTMTLGKFQPTTLADGTKDFSIPGPDSYIVKAGNTTYFSLGTKWNYIIDTYNLDKKGDNMFDYFNKPALDDAVKSNKIIRFSDYPEDYKDSSLMKEWDYLQSQYGYEKLKKNGDYWYAK